MGTPGATVVFCTACGAHNQPDARFCQTCGQPMIPVTPVPITASVAAYAANPYGGFWIRVVAYIIDMIVVELILIPFSLALGIGLGITGAATHMPDQGVQIVGALSGMAFGIFGMWLYEALMTSSSKQATLGKMAMGLRVTDLDGRRISFVRATGRYFAKYISAMILCIGYIMVGFTERKQGLHDMIAGTLVMKGRT